MFISRLEVISLEGGIRKIKMGKNSLKMLMKPDEILLSILIPRSENNQHVLAYKQSRRRDVDTSIINSAINVVFDPESDVIQKLNLSFGGLNSSISIPSKTCSSVIGMSWNKKTLEHINEGIVEELFSGMVGGMILYRKSLVLSLVFKAYLHISQELEKRVANRGLITESERSGSEAFQLSDLRSSQFYEVSK